VGSSATTSVRVLRAVALALQRRGGDPRALLAELGVEAAALEDGEARVPFALLQDAWLLAARRSGDDAFGLHLAEALAVGEFDVLDYVARSSATLAAAFERLARYHRLLHDDVVVSVEHHGGNVAVVHRRAGDLRGVTRHAAEAALASWVLRARLLTGVALAPEEIRFQHPRPADVGEHRRILRCPIVFSSPTNVLVWSRAQAALPLVSADPGLCAILDRHAREVLARVPAGDFLGSVRAAIAESMRGGAPTLDGAAQRLHMSRRSLQRRLAEEEVSFSAVVEALRRELAFQYLGQKELALGEVAFLVGFSEPSAFTRAFKRWAGCTPLEYRQRDPTGR
jgi:AraC-like DNA-binding protein